jgi:hypothetical protein
MHNLLRKPLPWMVVSEFAIVAVLAMVAWHMVASPPVHQIQGAGVVAPTAPARERGVPAPKAVAGEATAPKPLLPGLNMDSSFWKQRLAELNRSESSFEQLEWRIVHSAMDAARRYVKSVVLPAVGRAERGAG